MTELIAKILAWIWSKLLVLMVIVFILLTIKWVHNEWQDIKAQWTQVSEMDSQISDQEALVLEMQKKQEQLSKVATKAKNEFDSLKNEYSDAKKNYDTAKAAYKKWDDLCSWWDALVENEDYQKRHKAKKEQAKREDAKKEAYQAVKDLRKKHFAAPWAKHEKKLAGGEKELSTMKAKKEALLNDAGRTPMQKFIIAFREVLPKALWILVGIILSPIAIKAFLYYVVAPLISRTKPVVIAPDASGDISVTQPNVSKSVGLEPGDDLLVHSSYLQAAGAGPGKRTRLLFSWHMPFTSLAAGLYAMVVVRNKGNNTVNVTVSTKTDLYDKVCQVHIPRGGSLVVYPRSLVGMVMKNGKTPEITRHWRLGSLHSWVTFQFRYIVIHGESRIFIKGCRGVRAERVEIEKPGMQDKVATIGFTTNLGYSGVRCDTFVDYLLSRDELFNDRFSGAGGFFFTEEAQNPNRKKGIFNKGLEGVVDGLLKAFGI